MTRFVAGHCNVPAKSGSRFFCKSSPCSRKTSPSMNCGSKPRLNSDPIPGRVKTADFQNHHAVARTDCVSGQRRCRKTNAACRCRVAAPSGRAKPTLLPVPARARVLQREAAASWIGQAGHSFEEQPAFEQHLSVANLVKPAHWREAAKRLAWCNPPEKVSAQKMIPAVLNTRTFC
jgi:hypothetical protein